MDKAHIAIEAINEVLEKRKDTGWRYRRKNLEEGDTSWYKTRKHGRSNGKLLYPVVNCKVLLKKIKEEEGKDRNIINSKIDILWHYFSVQVKVSVAIHREIIFYLSDI